MLKNSNPQDTAPPRPRLCQQSPRHGGTQTTPWSAIPMTRRHPEDALVSNSNDTASPTKTPWSAIPMTRRRPEDALPFNPNGTAAPTRHAHQQSPWHSATHAAHVTRPTPIPTACHCVPRHSAAHATRPTQPAAAFQETSAPSSHPRIHGFPAPATISQRLTRERARAADFSGPRNLAISAAAHDSLRLPRKTMPSEATGRTIPHACHAKRTLRARFPTPATRIHVRDIFGGHLVPHLPRETHAHQRPNARFPTPATRIHPPAFPSACASMHPKSHTCHVKRTRTNVQMHVSPHLPRGSTLQPSRARARQCIRSPTPATRNARPPSPHATRPDANPHGTELKTRPREHRANTERTPSGQAANEANTGPAPRPPDYKREPSATHSGKNRAGKQLSMFFFEVPYSP